MRQFKAHPNSVRVYIHKGKGGLDPQQPVTMVSLGKVIRHRLSLLYFHYLYTSDYCSCYNEHLFTSARLFKKIINYF